MQSRTAVIALLLVGLSWGASATETREPLSPSPDQPPMVKGDDPPVGDGTPQAWGLAADALLTEENGMSHHLLAAQPLDSDARSYATSMLNRWWNVNNRDDLHRVLDNLENQGQRQRFDEMGKGIDALSDPVYELLIACAKTFTDDWQRLQLVHDHHRALGNKSLLGWDLMRYIDVNRKAYAAGYLGRQEAWQNIMRASRRLQSTFGSWKELGDNYLLGRHYWNEEEYQQRLKSTMDAYDRLLHDPRSPWVVNAWNIDLGPVAPATVTTTSRAAGTRSG